MHLAVSAAREDRRRPIQGRSPFVRVQRPRPARPAAGTGPRATPRHHQKEAHLSALSYSRRRSSPPPSAPAAATYLTRRGPRPSEPTYRPISQKRRRFPGRRRDHQDPSAEAGSARAVLVEAAAGPVDCNQEAVRAAPRPRSRARSTPTRSSLWRAAAQLNGGRRAPRPRAARHLASRARPRPHRFPGVSRRGPDP